MEGKSLCQHSDILLKICQMHDTIYSYTAKDTCRLVSRGVKEVFVDGTNKVECLREDHQEIKF